MASIGKAMCVLIAVMVVSVALVTIFSIAIEDKSTDAPYLDINNSVNGTAQMTQSVASAGTGFMASLILVVAVLFFGAVIMIFRKK